MRYEQNPYLPLIVKIVVQYTVEAARTGRAATFVTVVREEIRKGSRRTVT